MNDLRGTTAGWTGPGEWEYRVTRDGVETGEIHRVGNAQFASDMMHLVKRRFAEEQRQRPEATPMPAEIKTRCDSEVKSWLAAGVFELERAQHSIAQKIIPPDLPFEAHTLLVQHDWGKVLEDAKVEGLGEDPRLPYEITVFEFLFKGGVRAVVVSFGIKDEEVKGLLFFKTHSGWTRVDVSRGSYNPHGSTPIERVLYFLELNIRAVCIMLEAEVAEIMPVREPYKRNSAATRKALPMFSHHIVSLARRVRLTPCDDHEPGTPKRLHFRRGHWRHYVSHRTWIKWTLVGNPDLGFVDKEYRL